MSENIESVKPMELTPSELDLVSGGLSLNFTKIEWTYTQQKPAVSTGGDASAVSANANAVSQGNAHRRHFEQSIN